MSTQEKEYGSMAAEARNYVWLGAIPLYLELHKDEIVTLPAPRPFMLLAPRNGYLPLLVDAFRPHFQSALPPGSDTVWFDYNGLPLKWHIPTGVLFDLICVEPQRPWRLTVHFRAYPSDTLMLCDGEEAAKWNFINSLKEASYIMHGNTKTVMNLSPSDQLELWRSVVKADGESYDRISVRLRPGSSLGSARASVQRGSSVDASGDGCVSKPGWGNVASLGRIPVRLYIRHLREGVEDLFDVPDIASWDEVAYVTRPIEVPKDKGKIITLRDALIKFVPQLFSKPPSSPLSQSQETDSCDPSHSEGSRGRSSDSDLAPEPADTLESVSAEPLASASTDVKEDQTVTEGLGVSANGERDVAAVHGRLNGIVRIQGIEPELDLPLDWTVRNLCGPERFVHIIVFTWVPATGQAGN